MARTSHLTTGIAAVAIASTTALTLATTAVADPAAPPADPASAAQMPGLPAIEQLSPVIQQAAADPEGAVQLLMAAAAAFKGNNDAPADSKQVADSVADFVQAEPVAHMPAAAGVEPGAQAHLPTGVNPANAVGPVPIEKPHAMAAKPTPPGPADAPAAAPPAEPGEAPGDVPAVEPAAAEAAANPDFGPDAPPTQEFMYPSIGTDCLADGGNVIASALSVAGPAKIPTPGPGPGQTAYVFTAVGTPGPAEKQKLPLNVTWVNLTTGKSGTVALTPRDDINPEGPTTLTAIVDTGSGSVMSTIFGQVTTKDKQCQFMPTIGATVVP
ncbi:hypothetical protein AWC30_08510 [Mycolicibacillus trivialis]|uniref:Uncharacterized protein n=2 Tax=Mycolicibacillus trivialis TaxID=1798 RepID=A0A1X2EMN1_9MYCO|nr:hypothetical protein [Mycolicibacillus trivialis]ORX05852.1 hypothetical protein AWC30_08510 [Mycolicibacillus trivialis]